MEILPRSQRNLWPELFDVPSTFVLYGGTGIALHLGHRSSVDFDFFSSDGLDHAALMRIPFVKAAQVLQEQPDALTISVDRDGPVKVSFFGPVGIGARARTEAAGDAELETRRAPLISTTRPP
jgi:hypothetical protein